MSQNKEICGPNDKAKHPSLGDIKCRYYVKILCNVDTIIVPDIG